MRKRTVEVFMWIAAVGVASNIYLFIPIYSEVAEALSITYEEVVYSSTLFTFCYSVGLLSFGPISETFAKKKVLLVGMILSSLLTYVISCSYSLSSFYLFRSLQGFILGSFAPVAYAYCFDVFGEKRRTFVIAVINMGFLMAGIIGQLISSTIVEMFYWKGVFYFYASLYFLLTCFSIVVLPAASHSSTLAHKRKEIFSKRLLKPQLIIGYAVTFFTLMSFVAFFDGLSRDFWGNPEDLFYIKSIALIGTPLSLFCGQWIKKYQAKTMIPVTLSIMIVTLLLMLLPGKIMMITVLATIYVAALAVFIPSLITFIGEVAGDNRSTAISLYSFLLLTGASLGPIVATYFTLHGIILLFSVIFGLGIFSLCILKE